MLTYTREQTSNLQAPYEKALLLLREEPEEFLQIAKIHVGEVISRQDDYGEWRVVESLPLPIYDRVTFLTGWTPSQNGAVWESHAPLSVHVKNTYELEATSDQLTKLKEIAVLRCPFFVYPITRFSFDRAHKQLHVALQRYFEDAHKAPSPPTT